MLMLLYLVMAYDMDKWTWLPSLLSYSFFFLIQHDELALNVVDMRQAKNKPTLQN